MESTVWKFAMKIIVHSIWKEYRDYNMSFLMLEYVLRNANTHRDLYTFVLLKFDIVENNICIVSFLLVL